MTSTPKPESSPAPQPEGKRCPHCVDGKVFTDSEEPDCVTCDGTGEIVEPPAPLAGARELTPQEFLNWWNQNWPDLAPTSQALHAWLNGAAQERARADKAERVAHQLSLEAEAALTRAKDAEAEVESLRKELEHKSQELEEEYIADRQIQEIVAKYEADNTELTRSLGEMRDALTKAVDQAASCECDNNGDCGYCVGAALLFRTQKSGVADGGTK